MLFDHWYAVDIGARMCLFYDYASKKQTELKTCVAWENDRPVGVSDDAISYLYKDQRKISVKYPLDHERILSSFAPLIKQGFKDLGLENSIFQPHLLVVTPTHMDAENLEAWHNELIQAGIQKMDFISVMDVLQTEEPTLLIHSGHSYTELGIYAHGHEYVHKTIYFAGKQVDEAIIQHVARRYRCLISEEDACALKEAASQALWKQKNVLLRCNAKNQYNQFIQIEIRSVDLWPCMESVIQQITLWAQHCLEQVPVELKEMIHEYGVLVSGGMASCFGLTQSIETALNQPVICTEAPYLDILENMKGWR